MKSDENICLEIGRCAHRVLSESGESGAPLFYSSNLTSVSRMYFLHLPTHSSRHRANFHRWLSYAGGYRFLHSTHKFLTSCPPIVGWKLPAISHPVVWLLTWSQLPHLLVLTSSTGIFSSTHICRSPIVLVWSCQEFLTYPFFRDWLLIWSRLPPLLNLK